MGRLTYGGPPHCRCAKRLMQLAIIACTPRHDGRADGLWQSDSASVGVGCALLEAAYMQASASGGRAAAGHVSEESPGSTKRGWRVTPAGRAARRGKGKCHRKQTADGCLSPEGRTGKGERVRQERTGALATGLARQTPPGARPNRGLAPARKGWQECFAPRGPGWLLERCSNAPPR